MAAAITHAADPPPKILIVYTHERLLPAVLRFDSAFRQELDADERQATQVFTEFLDSARFPGAAQEEAMATYLKARYADGPPQVIVAVANNAFHLFQARRSTLFPGTPLVFLGVGSSGVEQAKADGRMTGVPLNTRIEPTIQVMRTMQPDLREIVLIAGAADYDKTWDPAIEAETTRLAGQVKLTYWAALPLAEVRTKVAALPTGTAVLVLSYLRDPSGATRTSLSAVKEIAGASRVPVFGIYETYLGSGVVGGSVVSFADSGRELAHLVERTLHGESPGEIGIVPSPPLRFVCDARQLEHWHIRRESLPPRSELLFDHPPFHELHPRLVAGVAAAVLVQTGVIVGLLIHRRRRRRVEAALRVSEERYREVVENQVELVVRYLPDTTLTFVNETCSRFIGQPCEALCGKKFLSLLPVGSHPAIGRVVKSVIESKHPVTHEQEMTRADGQIRWIEWQDTIILDGRGQPSELQAIGRDITERKQMAEALTESERNLVHATQLALVGELTASIAHEINQPLGAILANTEAAEMLLASGSDEDLRPILADIRSDDLRASEIIQNVRSLVSKRTHEIGPLQLNSKIGNVVRLMTREGRRRGVEIITELADNLPEIEGDRTQIEQVLFNLLLNAMEAMEDTPKEKRRLLVRTRFLPSETVEVSVTDNGAGIVQERLSHVFDSFFTTKEKGMGLGLALARSIVESHGGTIGAENNPEGGATFRLRIPKRELLTA